MKLQISVTLDEVTIKRIDEARGLILRSTFINEMIKMGIAPAQTAKNVADASQNNTTNNEVIQAYE